MSEKKKLSLQDRAFIDKNKNHKSAAEMSDYIQAPLFLVEKYIKDNVDIEDYSISEELRSHRKWELWKEEFTADELRLFEYTYNEYCDQFSANELFATEKGQLFQLIELEIFMHRNKRGKKSVEEDIVRFECELREELSRDKELQNQYRIEDIERKLAACRAAIPSSSKEYNEYSKKHSDILKELRGTREQRVKQAADSRTNILEVLKSLEIQEFRDKQKIEMEMAKEAMKRKEKELGDYITIIDGEVHKPLLNEKTCEKEES